MAKQYIGAYVADGAVIAHPRYAAEAQRRLEQEQREAERDRHRKAFHRGEIDYITEQQIELNVYKGGLVQPANEAPARVIARLEQGSPKISRRKHRERLAGGWRAALSIWLQSNTSEHPLWIIHQERLAELDAEIAQLAHDAREREHGTRKQRLLTLADDGIETPEQTAWINAHADSDDPFAEFITASRHKALHGDWPNGVKPSHPSYEDLPIWKINWLRGQSKPLRYQQQQQERRRREKAEKLVAELVTAGTDSPPARLSSMADIMRARATQKPIGNRKPSARKAKLLASKRKVRSA